MARLFLLLLCVLPSLSHGFYSINYASKENHPRLIGNPATFTNSPNAEQVANIVAQLAGRPPILREGACTLLFFCIFINLLMPYLRFFQYSDHRGIFCTRWHADPPGGGGRRYVLLI